LKTAVFARSLFNFSTFSLELSVRQLSSPDRDVISVIIADGDPLSCALLTTLLNGQPDFEVVATVGSQDSLLTMARQGGTDVALVGLDLADGPLKGLIAVRAVRELNPQLQVVLLLNQSEPHLVLEAMHGGSRGVFSRSEFEPAALFKCLQCVHQGQIWLNTQELGYLLAAWIRTPQMRVVDAQGVKLLSRREEDVVQLVVEGLGNREIAQRLSLSEHTIRNYLFKIFDKLGVSNRVELVLYATSNPRKIEHRNTMGQLLSHPSAVSGAGRKVVRRAGTFSPGFVGTT
jgi:DNA-binding NarL/FixJ family response regulator